MVEVDRQADMWLRHVDGLIPDETEKVESIRMLRQAYRAGAIMLMSAVGYSPTSPACPKDFRAGGYSRIVSEHFQSRPITTETRLPDRFVVGTVRDKGYSRVPAFLGGKAAGFYREEFYVRKLRGEPSDEAPDIRHPAWILPFCDVKLPDNGRHLYANKWQMARFGREIAELAIGIGCELPQTLEEIEATELG